MKILVLGSNGLLGSYFCKSRDNIGHEILEYNRNLYPAIDFLKPNSVIKLLEEEKPEIVINCAAITSFEYCEKSYDSALQVNAKTPSEISKYCSRIGAKFIHISTDHYYLGKERIAHTEEDKISLLNNYAITKHHGEQLILENSHSLILRTAIVGRTPQKRTFLDWLTNAIETRETVNLYEDSFTSFIHCNQLSKVIFELLTLDIHGIYNVGCADVFSKAEFCLQFAERLNHDLDHNLTKKPNLQDINKSSSCGLSSAKLINEFSVKVPTLKEVIEECALDTLGKLPIK